MINLKELKGFLKLNDSILNNISKEREETFTCLNQKEKTELKNMYKTRDNNYNKTLIAIDNIPDGFVLTKETITKNIGTYVENIEDIHSYLDTKYYAEGFKDRH